MEHVLNREYFGVHRVSKEIIDGVSAQEKQRHEAINEVIHTERDMAYSRDICLTFLNLLTVCVCAN